MILTLQSSTFGVFGGIPTYNRLVCKVLDEFCGEEEIRVLAATDKPADAERHAASLPRLRMEAFAGRRATFVRRAVALTLTHRVKLLLVGHVNYAPLALWLQRLQPRLRYGVMIYGVDAWTKLPWARREGLRRADFVVAISEYTKQRAIEANDVPAERFHVLPNALEYSAEKIAAEHARTPPPSGMRLLSVCRLDAAERYKGVDTVIESLPTIAAKVLDVQYFVVGGGTDVERHKQLAQSAGVADRVHFLGFVDDAELRAYYRACDVFVMPSAGEGFGFVYLEAMQYGKPVVAARSGGAPEVVEDGVTGALVEYGDVRQLAETLARLCLDTELRKQLGEAGYGRLQERFTFPQFKRRLTDILRDELQPTANNNAHWRSLLKSARSAGGRRPL